MPDNLSIETQQAHLLRRIAAQDSAALSEFYDQTAASLFSFALRMLNDAHDAEEVIQDVFMQIWNKAPSFDPAIGLPFSWSMSIVRNRCIDRLRSRQRHSRVIVETIDGGETTPQVEAGVVDIPLATAELAAVRSALGALPADQKRAIEMAFFGGQSHHEIAEELNEPLGTVKARIRRGMLKLRDELEVLPMISEQLQDQASLFVLGALTPEEQRGFEAELREHDELREWVLKLQRTTGLLAQSVAQASPPPPLKARILERIAATKNIPSAPLAAALPGLRFETAAGESGWKALPLPGAFIKLLSFEKERGYAVLLGKIEAGVRYPAHLNAGPEDFYILSGDLVVGRRRLGAGDFHHADKGSQHEVNYSEHGCTLLAVLTTEDPLVMFAMS